MNWAILVIYSDGSQEYVKHGLSGDRIQRFSKSQAEKQVEFMKIGMEGDDDIQSVNVVLAPKAGKR